MCGILACASYIGAVSVISVMQRVVDMYDGFLN
jgi:hypothetical protein